MKNENFEHLRIKLIDIYENQKKFIKIKANRSKFSTLCNKFFLRDFLNSLMFSNQLNYYSLLEVKDQKEQITISLSFTKFTKITVGFVFCNLIFLYFTKKYFSLNLINTLSLCILSCFPYLFWINIKFSNISNFCNYIEEKYLTRLEIFLLSGDIFILNKDFLDDKLIFYNNEILRFKQSLAEEIKLKRI